MKLKFWNINEQIVGSGAFFSVLQNNVLSANFILIFVMNLRGRAFNYNKIVGREESSSILIFFAGCGSREGGGALSRQHEITVISL